MLKVSGVVVLYHPDNSFVNNIQSYINFVDQLYVVDNSDIVNSDVVAEIKKIHQCRYVNNNGNQGIARALNVGVDMAAANGANWVLTMDQDSCFEQGALINMIEWLKKNDTKEVGIISPVHKIVGEKYNKSDEVIDVTSVMASGNLLNINAYNDVGGFREDFFIDYVDHEYCLRLSKFNFRVLLSCNSVLNHNLGASESISVLGHIVICTNHNFIRRYYITRNRLKVITMYFFSQPIYCLKDIKDFIISWIKIILFEKDSMVKQKSILLGMLHFLKGKAGKLSSEYLYEG